MANKFVIIYDSSLDLTAEIRKKYDIEDPFLGTIVFPDKSEALCDLNWEKTTPAVFYKKMSNKNNVFKTSLPNPTTIQNRLLEYVNNGYDVLAISLSSHMSGTFSALSVAAKEVMANNPNSKILILDSKRYSAGGGLLAVFASKLRAEGKTINETFSILENYRDSLHQIGILDDLFFLYRSGRIKKIAAVMGSFIGIKPMADFSNEIGGPCVLGKARGYKNAWKIVEKYIPAVRSGNEPEVFAVCDSDRKPQSDEIIKIIKKLYPNAEIIYTPVGQSCGVNVGPGLAVAFFLGKKVSKDCQAEKEIFANILKK